MRESNEAPQLRESRHSARMRRMLDDGTSFRSIAMELDAAGKGTMSGLGKWSFATDAWILRRDSSEVA